MTTSSRPDRRPATVVPAFLVASSTWRWAMLLAVTALGCGVLLGGVSVWFLGSVAIAGLSAAALTFNFHIPAALIRMFAVGRTAARYGERLVGHKAALRDQVARRVQLFRAMAEAPVPRRAGWQLGDQARLADYLDDVEDLDYGKLRIDLPALALGAWLLVATIATLAVAPLAMAPIAAVFFAILVAGGRMARAGAMAWERVRSLRREGARRLGTAMASAVPLQAEAVWRAFCDQSLDPFAQADRELLALRRAQARLDALAAMVAPAAGGCVIAAAWIAGRRGEALLAPAFLAFAWLALAEALQGTSRMLIAHLRRRAAHAEMARWTNTDLTLDEPEHRVPARLTEIRCQALQRRAPDWRPIGKTFAARFQAGRPTVLIGASGSGKTSLLKQIAGWIGNDAMGCGTTLLTPGRRGALSFFCPHDAAVVADTVRANLFVRDAADEALWKALEAVELADRTRTAGGLDAWITQDTLSLGEAQRLNLARAWLTDRPIVLLDEPSEHLDTVQGARILGRLLDRLRDRIVVLSSHHAAELPQTETVRL